MVAQSKDRLRHQHTRMKTHHSFAVRFAYWNILINGFFALLWGPPAMAMVFLLPGLFANLKFVSFISVWALFATHAGALIAGLAAYHAAEDNTRDRNGRNGGEPVGRTTQGGDW